MQFANDQQHVAEDTAFRLESRGVVRVEGDDAKVALAQVLTGFSPESEKAALAFLLDEASYLRAELFVVPWEHGFLIDCARSLISELAARLDALRSAATGMSVEVSDASDNWLVFAELPDQKTFDYGELCIKYSDPRWHMGSRRIRPKSNAVHSSVWGSELKWANHAMKLGFLPHAGLVAEHQVTLLEAGFHAILELDPAQLSEGERHVLANTRERLSRRVMPVRVEPTAASFPTLTGHVIEAEGEFIGKVLGHYGLYAIALVDITPWRLAIQARRVLKCNEQPVLITWPSWLAQESRGRGGPVAIASNRSGVEDASYEAT